MNTQATPEQLQRMQRHFNDGESSPTLRDQVVEMAAALPRPQGQHDPEYGNALKALRSAWNQLREDVQGILLHTFDQRAVRGQDAQTMFGLHSAAGRRHEAFRVQAFGKAIQAIPLSFDREKLVELRIARITKKGDFAYNFGNEAGEALVSVLKKLDESAAGNLNAFLLNQAERAAAARIQRTRDASTRASAGPASVTDVTPSAPTTEASKPVAEQTPTASTADTPTRTPKNRGKSSKSNQDEDDKPRGRKPRREPSVDDEDVAPVTSESKNEGADATSDFSSGDEPESAMAAAFKVAGVTAEDDQSLESTN